MFKLVLVAAITLCCVQMGTSQYCTQSISAAVMEALEPFIEEVRGNLSQINNLLGNLNDTMGDMDKDMNCIKEEMDICDCNPNPQPPGAYICGGTGGWRRVVYLNMTDDNAVCPIGWQDNGHSTRTCGRVSTGGLKCDSVSFPVPGGCYTKVCGRITAYQHVYPDGFQSYIEEKANTIDDAYVSGVSLTHGSPRQHIWTFACGVSQVHPTRQDVCPCDSDTNISVPPFVGADYFCESGHNETSFVRAFHADDPLWDGKGCASSSTCCSFNNPPYFTKMLSSPTTDDIEARICQLSEGNSMEDTPIELIELYVQ